MSEATKLAEYLGFEVVYLDGFAYIQEEGPNGPEIKRDATLEERTLWAELEHVSAELAEVRKQIGAQKDEWLSWDAKRSALEKDAERYLKLVRLFGVTKLPCLLESVVGDYVADGKQAIDSAIDAAMKGTP